MKKVLVLMLMLGFGGVLAACEGDDDQEALLEGAATALNIYSTDINDITNNFVVPVEGRNDTTIEWEVSPESVLSLGDVIEGDLTEQQVIVSRPAYGEGDADVTLIATLSLGDYETTREFDGRVREFSEDFAMYQSIQNLLDNASMNDELSVEGTVIGITNHNTFFIADDTAGISLYDPAGSYIDKVSIGDRVNVEGERGQFNGLRQIGFLDRVDVIQSNETLPDTHDLTGMDLTDDDAMLEYQGQRIAHDHLEIVDIDEQSNATNFMMESDDGYSITLRFDSRLDDSQDLANFLDDLQTGDSLSVDGVIMGWFNDPQLLVFDETHLTLID